MNSRIILVALSFFIFSSVYSQDKNTPITQIYLKDSYLIKSGTSKLQSYDAYLHELGDSTISFFPKTDSDLIKDPFKNAMTIPVEKISSIEYGRKSTVAEISSGILLGGVIGAGSGLIIGTISGYIEGADPGKAEIHIFTEGENYIPRSRGFKMLTRGMGYGLIGGMIGGLSGLIIRSVSGKSSIMIDGNQQTYEKSKEELSKRIIVF